MPVHAVTEVVVVLNHPRVVDLKRLGLQSVGRYSGARVVT